MKSTPFSFEVFLVLGLAHCIWAGSENRIFVLEKFTTCPKPQTYPIQWNLKNSSVKNNRLLIDGSVQVTESQKNDVVLAFRFKRCTMDTKSCGTTNEFAFPSLCKILSEKTVFGDRLGQAFQPPLLCPFHKGRYNMTINLSLKSFVRIPLDNIWYEAKLFIQDFVTKKNLACMEGATWLKTIKTP